MRIRSKVYLLFPLITLLSFSTTNTSENEWNIKIELSKQDYLLHEPVVLDVTLTNIASDTLQTHGLIEPNQMHFHILLTDSQGKKMKYTGPQSSIGWGPGELLLDAGARDYASFNLLTLFGSRESASGYNVQLRRLPFLPKGTYTVKVSYEGDVSSELTFSVVEPSGQEEEVLRKMEQASAAGSKGNTDPSSQIYGEIVRDYPNSVFAEKCYYLHRVYANNMEGLISLVKAGRILHGEMISRYPNSAEVRGWLLSITFGKNDDEKLAIYSQLIADNPDTRCSKIASLLKSRLLAQRGAKE